MQTPRLFRTWTFQIAVLYLCLYSATLVMLVAFIYWSTVGLIDKQVSNTIDAEIRGLAEQYRDEGIGRLVEVILERSGSGGDPANVYLLAEAELRPLAGNLDSWPEGSAGRDGWQEIELWRTAGETSRAHTIRARTFLLPGGYHLLVGRDAAERTNLLRTMVRVLAWALIPAFLLGLLGAVLIGRYSLRRVDAVAIASQEIVKGDLAGRVPLSGSGDEVDRLAQTMNEMLDQIGTLMAGMRAVTDSLAHDLRGPLTRAKSNIELALRKNMDAPNFRQALEQTGSELETILRTFEGLINIAQAEAGIGRLALEPLDLSALARDLAEVYQPIAEEADLDLADDIEAGVSVRGHRQLLGHAIANLIDNAIKYTPAGGRIRLSLGRSDGTPVLTVSDTGPGIAPADRERVLERFVRLDDSRRTPGSGLGLSLAAAVAKLHGSRLELADSEPGLKVTLHFPS